MEQQEAALRGDLQLRGSQELRVAEGSRAWEQLEPALPWDQPSSAPEGELWESLSLCCTARHCRSSSTACLYRCEHRVP